MGPGAESRRLRVQVGLKAGDAGEAESRGTFRSNETFIFFINVAHPLSSPFRSVGLHCNKHNAPAMSLYQSMGYRMTRVMELAVMPILNGRAEQGRCNFFVKRLSSAQGKS